MPGDERRTFGEDGDGASGPVGYGRLCHIVSIIILFCHYQYLFMWRFVDEATCFLSLGLAVLPGQ